MIIKSRLTLSFIIVLAFAVDTGPPLLLYTGAGHSHPPFLAPCLVQCLAYSKYFMNESGWVDLAARQRPGRKDYCR